MTTQIWFSKIPGPVVDIAQIVCRQRGPLKVAKSFDNMQLLNVDVRLDIAKAEFKTILFRIYEGFEHSEVNLLEKPVKGAFAKEPHAKDKLVLVPFTGAVVISLSSEKPPVAQHLELGKLVLSGSENSAFAMAKSSYKDQAPFWYVRTTHDAEEANCTLSNVKATLSQKAKLKSMLVDHSTDICIPLLTNTKAVSAGSEIVLYQPKPEKKQTEAFFPASKKQKQAK